MKAAARLMMVLSGAWAIVSVIFAVGLAAYGYWPSAVIGLMSAGLCAICFVANRRMTE